MASARRNTRTACGFEVFGAAGRRAVYHDSSVDRCISAEKVDDIEIAYRSAYTVTASAKKLSAWCDIDKADYFVRNVKWSRAHRFVLRNSRGVVLPGRSRGMILIHSVRVHAVLSARSLPRSESWWLPI